MRVLFYLLLLLLPEVVFASEPPAKAVAPAPLSLQEKLKARVLASPQRQRSSLIFDLPLTYNQRVSYWIAYFQTKGKSWFGEWLEKSTRYLPMIQKELRSVGLPQDLVYMVMIESGFEANAKSHADAVGPWQFISSTGTRYGLHVNYWLDERRDMKKSTLAAIHYLSDLYKEFGSWYLVAASYNMGETGLRRQINKFSTRDFWVLSQKGALPSETVDYVPKILAAMMIAKSPGVYGFDRLSKLDPVDYDVVQAPGGLDLNSLADHLGVTHKALRDLNAELVTGYIPPQIEKHLIRVPRGSVALATDFMARSTKR
jgi:membrane-bound lytic murein transglycosylase D